MAELPTVEIHSPKDPTQKWVINQDDYDPEKHLLWGHGNLSTSLRALTPPEEEREVRSHVPSAPDFVYDSDGNVESVNIIDPDRRVARKLIPYDDYDPARHELWSTHPRFNR